MLTLLHPHATEKGAWPVRQYTNRVLLSVVHTVTHLREQLRDFMLHFPDLTTTRWQNVEFLTEIIHRIKSSECVLLPHRKSKLCPVLQIVLKMMSHVYISMSFLTLITELEPGAQVSSLITSERERGLVLAQPCHELTGDVYF